MEKVLTVEENITEMLIRTSNKSKIMKYNDFEKKLLHDIRKIDDIASFEDESIRMKVNEMYFHITVRDLYAEYCVVKEYNIVFRNVLIFFDILVDKINEEPGNFYQAVIEKKRADTSYFTETIGADLVVAYVQKLGSIKRYLRPEEVTESLKMRSIRKLSLWGQKVVLEFPKYNINSLRTKAGNATTLLLSPSISKQIDDLYGGKCLFRICTEKDIFLGKDCKKSKDYLEFEIMLDNIDNELISSSVYRYNKGKIELAD